MKTGLGLNFLRIVNEEGVNGWSQVFARVPFGDEELKEKGALFGVIFSEELTDWMSKESEIMMWVDENFTNSDRIDLQKIAEYFDGKSEKMSYVWLWVSLVDGNREVRFIKSGEGGIWIKRDGGLVDLGESLVDGKIIKGSLLDGDKLLIWSGGLQKKMKKDQDWYEEKMVVEMGNLLAEDNLSAAGLMFTVEGEKLTEIKKVEKIKEIEEIKEDKSEEKLTTEDSDLVENLDEIEDGVEMVTEETEGSLVVEESRLVSDRYIGKVGPKEKLINWWKFRGNKTGDLTINRTEVEKKRKIFLLVGLVFLGLLVGSVAVGTVKIKRENELKTWNAFYEPLEKKRQEALGLKEINLVGSRKLMEEVKVDFDLGKSGFETGRFSQQLKDLEKVINSSWEEASGEKDSVVSERLDINLIREGFLGNRVGLIEGKKFVVLDQTSGTVVTADGGSKEILVAGKDEVGGGIDVINDGKRNLFLYRGMIQDVKSRNSVMDFDSAVVEPVSLGVFGSNVYVLDKANREIYKFVNGGGNLGERTRWLKEGEALSSLGVDMAIDGDVWILYEDGTVGKFRRGVEERFALNGAEKQSKSTRLAVALEGENLALLSEGGDYILVFNKETGDFKKQLKLGSVGKAADIEFDEQGNLWALVGGSLLVLE